MLSVSPAATADSAYGPAATASVGNGNSSAPGTGRAGQRPLLSVAVSSTDGETVAALVAAQSALPPVPPQPAQDVTAPPPAKPVTSPRTSGTSLTTPAKDAPPSPAHAKPTAPQTGTAATATAKAPAASSPARASPCVPLLQLPVPPCTDEVTPVRTLYNRLFREAQEREQRQQRAQEKRRAEQQEREKETYTFKPHVLAGHTAIAEAGAAVSGTSVNSVSPPRRSSAASPDASTAAADVSGEAVACARLYRNATEQAERRERRLQALRDAQEAEFAAQCTFRPSVSPVRGEGRAARSSSANAGHASGVQGSEARQRGRGSSTPARPTQQEQHQNGNGTAGGASPSPSTRHRTPSRSWKDFLAAQEEMQSVQQHRLEELRRKAAEESRPGLYAGVPRSKASQHLRRYLEKEKQYKGPIEGWSAHYAHYVTTHHLPGAAALDVLQESSGGSGAEAQAATPPSRTTRSHSHQRNTGNGADAKLTTTKATTTTTRAANAAAVAPVFDRLFRDSTERTAVRELIRLMQEQREHAELYKPNATHADPAATSSPNSARTPRTGQRQASASSSPATARSTHAVTATAIALAAGGESGSGEGCDAASPPEPQPPTAPAASVFDALHAEQMELQRRRELRHLQAENDAETFSFRPSVDTHSRTLVAERARRQSDGQAVQETVRERRARAEADAAAAEAARRAQVHFSYSTFAQRQAERDRRRQEELLMLLLQERRDDVGECRFRPALSGVTEGMLDGRRTYAQIIDNPHLANHVAPPFPALAGHGPSAAAAPRPGAANGSSAARAAARFKASSSSAPVQPSPQRVGAIAAAAPTLEELAHSVIDSADAFATMPSVSPPAQGREALLADLGGSQRGAALAAHAATSSERQAQRLASRDPSSNGSNLASASREVAATTPLGTSSVNGEDGIGTVRVAGAASSTYLRQLESELQDALRDWSQCI